MIGTLTAALLIQGQMTSSTSVDHEVLRELVSHHNVLCNHYGEHPSIEFDQDAPPTQKGGSKQDGNLDPKLLEKRAKEAAKFEAEILDDKKIGKEAADYYDRQYPPTKSPESQKRVEEIGGLLATIANANPFETTWGDKRHSEFEYKFKVVENADINAFSLPGGYIYVYQGLVDFCQSDDELAGVLSHEICHASQRHLAVLRKEQERVSSFQVPLILISVLTGGAASAAGAIGAGNLVGTAITNGWSQKAELSADYGGFQLMAAGGYDPTGMITFMERLQMQQSMFEKVMDLGIYRTHPPSKTRAQNIEKFMQKNLMPVRRSKVTTAFRILSKMDVGHPTLYFGSKRLFSLSGANGNERAAAYTKALNEFLDKVPEMFEVTLGDSGEIFGKNKLLMRLTEDDAKANGVNLEKLQNDVSKQLRSAIFTLAYHIWEGRG
jgi:beta-barrel assembly-enhancing protease